MDDKSNIEKLCSKILNIVIMNHQNETSKSYLNSTLRIILTRIYHEHDYRPMVLVPSDRLPEFMCLTSLG